MTAFTISATSSFASFSSNWSSSPLNVSSRSCNIKVHHKRQIWFQRRVIEKRGKGALFKGRLRGRFKRRTQGWIRVHLITMERKLLSYRHHIVIISSPFCHHIIISSSFARQQCHISNQEFPNNFLSIMLHKRLF